MGCRLYQNYNNIANKKKKLGYISLWPWLAIYVIFHIASYINNDDMI